MCFSECQNFWAFHPILFKTWKLGQQTPSLETTTKEIFFFGLTLSASVWNRISRKHTKYLIQTIIISIELKLCEVSRNSFSNRCWNFHLYSLKNKKVLFLKKTHHNKKRALFTDSIFREGFDFGNFNFDCSWRRKTLYRKSRESNLSNEFTTIGAASSVARKWA